jgi:putative membrane protein
MKILAVIAFLIITVIALIFSLLNFQSVDINLYFFSVRLPLAIALTLELFAGIGIGMLVVFMQIIKLKSSFTNSKKLNTAKEK